jgi:hypothetical protein
MAVVAGVGVVSSVPVAVTTARMIDTNTSAPAMAYARYGRDVIQSSIGRLAGAAGEEPGDQPDQRVDHVGDDGAGGGRVPVGVDELKDADDQDGREDRRAHGHREQQNQDLAGGALPYPSWFLMAVMSACIWLHHV